MEIEIKIKDMIIVEEREKIKPWENIPNLMKPIHDKDRITHRVSKDERT